jgi:hypothetical protein
VSIKIYICQLKRLSGIGTGAFLMGKGAGNENGMGIKPGIGIDSIDIPLTSSTFLFLDSVCF